MSNSKPILYYGPQSPPCRMIMLVARILNLELELKLIDLIKGEHLKEEFLKINQFHEIPVLIDNDGTIMTESRAICTYLIQTRQPLSKLYPSDDLKQRSQIDRWLFFDCSFNKTISAPFRKLFYTKKLDENDVEIAKKSIETLNKVIGDLLKRPWKFLTSSDQMTMADISLYFSIDVILSVPIYDLNQYENIKKWRENVMEALEPYDSDEFFRKRGIELMKEFAKPFLQNISK